MISTYFSKKQGRGPGEWKMQTTAGSPIDYVAARVRKMWKQSHSNAILNRCFRWLGVTKPADVIYVTEYADGDWGQASLSGNPTKVWEFRGNEMTEVEAIGELDRDAIASSTPVIRYCCSEDNQRMLLITWYGSRAATGVIRKCVNGIWEFEERRWIS